MRIELSRLKDGVPIPLQTAGGVWPCSEGDTLLLDVMTSKLPSLRMAGQLLRFEQIAEIETGYSARFKLVIDTWAGRTMLRVWDGTDCRSLILEIGPHTKKLSQNEFDAMLAELAQHSQTLPWGLAPGLAPGELARRAPAAVHPAVIESQLPMLERLLSRFIADPPTATVRSRDRRPLDLTRRADLQTLRWLSRRPKLLDSIQGKGDAQSVVDPRTPIDQPNAHVSFDHPVTRYISFLLRRVRARLEQTSHALRNVRGRRFSDPDADAHARELADRVEAAIVRVDNVLKRSLFRNVRPEPMTETALQFISDHPLYSSLHKIARRLLSPGLAFRPNGDLYTSLKRTYDLFELLVLYRIIDALPRALGSGWATRRAVSLVQTGIEERFGDGSAWLYEGPEQLSLELRYQQPFGRVQEPPHTREFSSLSGLNIPDYILVLRRGKVPISWLILDAKYRSGRQAIDQGLGDIHRYRDALRIRDIRAAGAYIVVPRLQESEAPYGCSAYHAENQFGVLQSSLEDWLAPVLQWIEVTLHQVGNGMAPGRKPLSVHDMPPG
jgi:PD-(D/E)XK nuclease superfamily/Domain of unknown function (DUF2357)